MNEERGVKPQKDPWTTYWNELDKEQAIVRREYALDPHAPLFEKHWCFLTYEADMFDKARKMLAEDIKEAGVDLRGQLRDMLRVAPLLGDDDPFPLWTRAIVRAIRGRFPELENYTPEDPVSP
jgi:hypothetical protein